MSTRLPGRRRRRLVRSAPRSGWRLGTVALVVAFTLLSLAAPSWGSRSGSSTGGSSVGPSPATVILPFAERAGYVAERLSEVTGVRAVSGVVSAELTFQAPLAPLAYAAAAAYFRDHGLRAENDSGSDLSLTVAGPAARLDAAFGTVLDAGSYQGSVVRFPALPPSLPSALEAEVAGVAGLESGFTPFSFDLGPASGVPAAGAPSITPGIARQYYGFSALYNLSGGPDHPNRLSIAVVLWGPGYAPSDLSTFFSNYYPPSSANFTVGNITAFPVDNTTGPSDSVFSAPDQRAVEELTLDIEWAESMAPGANIDVVYTHDGPGPSYSPSAKNLTDALRKAIALDPSVISMSFGTPESGAGSLESLWAPLFTQAANRGITVLAATGDTGGDTTDTPSCSGTPAPEYPSTAPNVIAVGGTNLTVHHPIGGTTYTEIGWASGGGGFSSSIGVPYWQKNLSASGKRGTPDVAATSSNNFLYEGGSSLAASGTSFATPLWAGLVADLDAKWGHSLGLFSSSLYHVGWAERTGRIGSGLADITSGGNCVASAVSGWDAATGWGSPRAAVLYNDLLGSFVNIALQVSQPAVAPGGSLTVTAVLTNRTTAAPIAGVAVELSLSADTNLGPCAGTFGSAAPVTNGAGLASATFSVPICYLGQHANVNASVTTTKLYGVAGEKVGVNLLGFDPALQVLDSPPWVYLTYVLIVGSASVLGAWLGRPRAGRPPVRRAAPRAAAPGPPVGASGSTPPPPPTPRPPDTAASGSTSSVVVRSPPSSAPQPPPPEPVDEGPGVP